MRHYIYNKRSFKKAGTGALACAVALTACGLGSMGSAQDVARTNYLDDEEVKTEDVAKKDGSEDKLDTEELVKKFTDSVSISEKDVFKDETVYAFTDPNGNINNILVNEVLRNPDKKATLEDETDLSGIVNLKGDETFSQEGSKVTWNANGNDIYYQGTTDKSLPVTMKATYYLNGSEVKPAELAGASGRVKIRFDYTNNATVTKKVAGKEEEMHVPFLALTGMILNSDFSNITVTNGKVTTEGNSNIVVGYALPGLTESLDIDKDDTLGGLTLPDYFEIEADVNNFSMDMTMTVLVDASAFQIDGELDTSELDDLVNKLDDAGKQLEDGSKQLADGAKQLDSGTGELSTGASKVAGGADQLAGGLGSLTNGADQLAGGLSQLEQSSGVLSNGVGTLNSSAAALSNGIDTLDAALNAPMSEDTKNATYALAYGQAKETAEKAATDQAAAADYSGVGAKASTALKEGGQLDAIAEQAKAGAEEGVKGKSEEIAATAAASAEQLFKANYYDAVKAQALEKFGANFTADNVYQLLAANDDLKLAIAGAVKAQYLQGALSQVAPNAAAMTGDQVIAAVSGAVPDDGTIAAIVDQQLQGMAAKMAGGLSGYGDAFATGVADACLDTAKSTAASVAPTVAVQTAGEVAGQVSQQTAVSVAEQLAPQVAKEAAVTAAGQAAGEAAGQAAGQAAIAGAEGAKSQIATQIEAVQANGYSLVTGAKALAGGTQTLNDSVPALIDGVSKLSNGAGQLKNGAYQLSDGAGQLKSGANQLAAGASKLADGTKQLSTGADQLHDGIVEFNKQAIGKLVDAYNGDLKELYGRICALAEAGTEYDTFTALPEGESGMTKFIIKTEGISVSE
ncbi:MAG: hypothetical protein IKO61_04060 [Lachnospiraceae bacterium]|nr:hypothetical protein [Lachnospiraceae bacterium]